MINLDLKSLYVTIKFSDSRFKELNFSMFVLKSLSQNCTQSINFKRLLLWNQKNTIFDIDDAKYYVILFQTVKTFLLVQLVNFSPLWIVYWWSRSTGELLTINYFNFSLILFLSASTIFNKLVTNCGSNLVNVPRLCWVKLNLRYIFHQLHINIY